jgi:hypothetical protein
MKRNILPICTLLAAISLAAPSAESQPLSFFKNYFVTGDYRVASALMNAPAKDGWATGAITMSDRIPDDADVVAAFLYWQAVELNEGDAKVAKFRGKTIQGKALGGRTSPCWSGGGATGSSEGRHALRTYRTDVLRYLEADAINGRRNVKDSHGVSFRNGGGNQAPVKGATLVIVYRAPGNDFRGVVLYDGAFTLDQTNDSFNLDVKGFYQAAEAVPAGRLTHLVGDGQANFSERLLVNDSLVATNPFQGLIGGTWDNIEAPVSTFKDDGSSINTRVDRVGLSSFDCLSWSAVIFSTKVQDRDKDGLLDTWEDNGFREITNPGFLVDLPGMGANKDIPDVFVEIDYMVGDGHVHAPKPAALEMVRSAFAKAPTPIRIHFDYGQGSGFTRGGNIIPENPTALFPGTKGVVGWKSGLRALKDRHFDSNRKDIFRYVVFAHALGLPTVPATNAPRSTSGIADINGGDALIAFGLWRSDLKEDDQTGSVEQQAGTLMHELGHTFGLRHAGLKNTPGCQPNYQSSMNYLFQVNLLSKDGVTKVVDYSRAALPQLNESSLSESQGLGPATYLARWYAPPQSVIEKHLARLGVQFVTRHCDGSPLASTEPRLIKKQAASLIGYLDWNNDGVQTPGHLQLDVNFNGIADSPYVGTDDWSTIDLRQVGARRNAGGLSGNISRDDLAEGDIASGDIASGDIASGDIASGDIASGDIASGDIASIILDQLDVDFDTANSTVESPRSLVATAAKTGIALKWVAPAQGQIRRYKVYRAVGAITGENAPALIETVVGASESTRPPVEFTDSTTKKNSTYTYFVTAVNASGAESVPSNLQTLKQ